MDDGPRSRLGSQRPPQRLISLVPSFSQTLLAIGAEEVLVGRTDFDTAAALAHLPSVGTGLQPSLEAIVALNPDAVLGFAGPSDTRTPSRLGEMGIPFVGLRADGIEELHEVTRLLGILTDREGEADSLVARIRQDLQDLRHRTESLPKIRTAILIGGTPPWVAGPGSYLDQLLEIGGGVNIFHDLELPFGPVSPEVFASRPMDLILAGPGTEIPRGIAGVRRAALPPGIEIPGPNVSAAAAALARLLHPEVAW